MLNRQATLIVENDQGSSRFLGKLPPANYDCSREVSGSWVAHIIYSLFFFGEAETIVL